MTDILALNNNQIGGCITIITTSEARIVIDYGENLPGFEESEKISIDWDIVPVDAVLFTHYHADHIGRFMEIPESIPLYMGECTRRVLINTYKRLKLTDRIERLESSPNIHIFEDEEFFKIKDIGITPYRVDHSAFDSYMFFIETPGKNILHTGDYRDHGYRGHKSFIDGEEVNTMLYTIENYIKRNGRRQIDVLITEGTLVGGDSERAEYSEMDMQTELMDLFKEKKYVFLKISSTNADSLLSFYRAARVNGMGFYAPDHVLEQMKLFEEMSESSYFSYCYTPSWPLLHRNESENTCEKYKRAFTAQRCHMREEGFVAVVSEYDEDLFEEFADLDPILIYSMWGGYIDKELGGDAYNEKLAEFCERHNAMKIHTCGHATPRLIEEVIRCASPTQAIIPIHTCKEEAFRDLAIGEENKEILRSGGIVSYSQMAENEDFRVPQEYSPLECLRRFCAEANLLTDDKSPYGLLSRLCFDGLFKRYKDVQPSHIGRLTNELEVIKDKGLVEYFLIVSDLISYARTNNIAVGPGRGAQPGCLFSYCLYLTDVDPIEYDLLFERLLNRSRPLDVLPMVVTDVEPGGIHKIMEYASEKYGKGMPNFLESLEIYFSESKELSVIKDSLRNIEVAQGTVIDISEIDLNDCDTFDLIRSGDADDVFLLDEDDIKEFLRSQEPKSIEDLMAAFSLCRPGLEDRISKYFKLKNDPKGVSYEIPELESILSSTYGCVVYQEQIMLILQSLAGFSPEQSDFARRDMAKKMLSSIDIHKQNFVRGNPDEGISGCISNGISEETANLVFRIMERAACYAFNKSHATAYTLLTYRMAWLKTHYRSEFLMAVEANKDKECIVWSW